MAKIIRETKNQPSIARFIRFENPVVIVVQENKAMDDTSCELPLCYCKQYVDVVEIENVKYFVCKKGGCSLKYKIEKN